MHLKSKQKLRMHLSKENDEREHSVARCSWVIDLVAWRFHDSVHFSERVDILVTLSGDWKT